MSKAQEWVEKVKKHNEERPTFKNDRGSVLASIDDDGDINVDSFITFKDALHFAAWIYHMYEEDNGGTNQ